MHAATCRRCTDVKSCTRPLCESSSSAAQLWRHNCSVRTVVRTFGANALVGFRGGSPWQRLERTDDRHEHSCCALPACVRDVLSRGALVALPHAPLAAATHAPMPLPIDHVYLIHYSRNARRADFQREQLPRLGDVNASVVTAYDQEELAPVRQCPALKQ